MKTGQQRKQEAREKAVRYAANSLRIRADQLFGLAYNNYDLLEDAVAYRQMADEIEVWACLTAPSKSTRT